MTNENFSKDTLILGVPAGEIAGIVEQEGGIFVGKCYEGLLAIVQSMVDMTESGKFGTGLNRVLRYHFPAPAENYHPECLKAVEDVFLKGRRRNPEWQILQIRSFARYADENGEPDREKTEALNEKYRYLGKDGVSKKRGRFYFGKKKVYRVELGRYKLRSNARLLQNYMHLEGHSCVTRFENDLFVVLAGSFAERDGAEDFAARMRTKGYKNAAVCADF